MTFLAQWLLAGAAAVAVPIAIHLISRRRHRTLDWAAMDFLLAAAADSRRRTRIEAWLLLLLRCAAVLLLSFALARPALPAAAETPLEIAILLDGSLSMTARDGPATRFDRAREMAQGFLSRLPETARVSVFLASDGADPLALRGPPALAARRIREASPTDRATDLAASLRAARRSLPAAGSAEWIVLTDAHRTSLGPSGGAGLAAEAAGIRREGGRIRWVEATRQPAENAGVLSLSAPPGARAAEPFLARASLRVLPARPGKRPIHLRIDGERRASAMAEPRPDGTLEALFPVSIAAPGFHVLSAEIEPDALAADNRFDLVLFARDRISVLAVDGEVRPGAFASASACLAAALAPSPVPGPFAVETVRAEAFRDRPPAPGAADVWALAGVDRIRPSDARLLESHLRRGKGLLVFLGPNVDAAAWTEAGAALLGCAVEPWAAAPPGGRGLSVPRGTGFLEAFRTRPDLSLSTVRLKGLAPLRPASGRARVILATGDGTPAGVASDAFGGRIAAFGFGADLASSNLPVRPAFLPLIHRVCLELAGDPAEGLNRRVGDRLSVPVDPARGSVRHVLRPAGGMPIPGTLSEEDGRFRLSFGTAERAGLHRIEPGDGSPAIPLAVSPDPDECDLRPLPADALAALPRDAFEISRRLEGPSARPVRNRTRDLSGRFLWILAGLLAVESILAARFARRRVAA